MEQPRPSTNRLRFDIAGKFPSIAKFEQAQDEAKLRLGCTIELPWRTSRPEHLFILSCLWNIKGDGTEWTLVEIDKSESKVIWNKKFLPNDIRNVYDTVIADTGSYPDGATATFTNLIAIPMQGNTGAYPVLGNQGTTGPMPTIPFPILQVADDRAKASRRELGRMLIVAGLNKEASIAAAQRLQDFIEDGRITSTLAASLLAKYHAAGAGIEAYVPKPTTPHQSQTLARLPALDSPYDLLQKAGVITMSDLEAARLISSQHNFELDQVLKATGKLEPTTLDAANISIGLIREGLMQLEQSVAVLHNCQTKKIDFDNALEQLGWPNPRKTRPVV